MKSLWGNLLVRFSIMCLVVLVCIAVSFIVILYGVLRSQQMGIAVDHAAGDANLLFLNALTYADFEAPLVGDRLDSFDAFARQAIAVSDTVMVKIWSRDGTLIYSSDVVDMEPGESGVIHPALREALSVETFGQIRSADRGSDTEASAVEFLEMYVPVTLLGGGEPIGAAEIYQSFEPTAQLIASMRTWLVGSVAVGAAVLYGTLLTIVWSASRTIRRQQSALTNANADLRAAKEAVHEAHDVLESNVEARTAELASANTSLKEKEKRYRSLIETIPHGIVEFDASGLISACNMAYHSMHGYAQGELVGKPAVNMIASEQERDNLSAQLARVMKDQPPPTSYLTTDRTKDGGIIDIQVGWGYRRDELGRVLGIVSVITDITKRKRAEAALRQSEARHRNLFEQANDSIFVIDPQTLGVMDVNENAARQLGYTRDELLQMTLEDIDTPMAAESNTRIPRELRQSGSVVFEHAHRRKDGTVMPVEISSRIVEFSGQQVIQSIVRNISDRKRRRKSCGRASKSCKGCSSVSPTG